MSVIKKTRHSWTSYAPLKTSLQKIEESLKLSSLPWGWLLYCVLDGIRRVPDFAELSPSGKDWTALYNRVFTRATSPYLPFIDKLRARTTCRWVVILRPLVVMEYPESHGLNPSVTCWHPRLGKIGWHLLGTKVSADSNYPRDTAFRLITPRLSTFLQWHGIAFLLSWVSFASPYSS